MGRKASTPSSSSKHSGSKHAGAAAASSKKPAKYQEASEEESDGDEELNGNIALMTGRKARTEDDEDDDEVFDLKGGDSDSSSDEDDDSEDDASASEDDDDDDDDDFGAGLGAARGLDDSDEDEDGDEEGEDAEGDWGRKKKTYWTGDTADLEIGQDFEDAEDEEAAAQDLHRSKLKRTTKDDYAADYTSSDDDDESVDEDEQDGSKAKGGVLGQQELLALGTAMGSGGRNSGLVEQEVLQRDLLKMSKKQRMAVISSESPELLGLYADLQEKLTELHSRIMPLNAMVAEIKSHIRELLESGNGSGRREDDLVQYLEVKQQLLLSYCTNIVFYLLLKVEGQSVKHHPVMKQLLELRYAMEKMRPLDGKLSVQIERLMKFVTAGAGGAGRGKKAAATLRPNPMALMAALGGDAADTSTAAKKGKGKHADTDEEDDNDDDDEGDEEKEQLLYRPPKMSAAIFHENESASQKADSKLQKQRKKLKNSEILESLQEEFSAAPESSSSTGLLGKTAEEKRIEAEMEERRKFEEDRFVRLTLTRKDKQAIKKREREQMRGGLGSDDLLGDIGDVGELDSLVEMNAASSSARRKHAQALGSDLGGGSDDEAGGSMGNALRAALLQAQGMEGGSKGLKHASQLLAGGVKAKKASKTAAAGGYDDDDELDGDSSAFRAMLEAEDRKKGGSSSSSGRRKAPAMDDDELDFDYMGGAGAGDDEEEDDDSNLLDAFAERKRGYQDEKDSVHTAHKVPRYGGYDGTVEEGQKRKATYQILKNKGLMPHRKKENRNPRVKKREAYHKAIVNRKGGVREAVAPTTSYGGELTGIKSNLSRSRRMDA